MAVFSRAGAPAPQERSGPKRITVAIMGDPSGLSNTIDRAGAEPGRNCLRGRVGRLVITPVARHHIAAANEHLARSLQAAR